MKSLRRPIPVPSIPVDQVAKRKLRRKAFLCHEGAEKRGIISHLRAELRRSGVPDEKVFYDEYMRRGGNIEENQKNSLMRGLLESEYLIAFLTPRFLSKRWPIWELKTFLDMMNKDKRRKLLPVFYKISAKECGNIVEKPPWEKAKELGEMVGMIAGKGKLEQYAMRKMIHLFGEKFGLTVNTRGLSEVLRKVIDRFGIDAQGNEMQDADVVSKIMEDVFETNVRSVDQGIPGLGWQKNRAERGPRMLKKNRSKPQKFCQMEGNKKRSPGTPSSLPQRKERWSCGGCGLVTDSKIQFEEHKKSPRHYNKNKAVWKCKACDVECAGQVQLDQHLQGTKHLKKTSQRTKGKRKGQEK